MSLVDENPCAGAGGVPSPAPIPLDHAAIVKPSDSVPAGSGEDKPHVFRTFEVESNPQHIIDHYTMMRTNQTVAFVDRMYKKHHAFDRGTFTLDEALNILDRFVDQSDPDTQEPQTVHAYQTAEAMRKDGQPDWMVLTGFIHDLGKIVYHFGTEEDGQSGTGGPQWAIAGDTWVVGCELPPVAVFPQFNSLNPDMADPVLGSEYGMYKPGCGLDNLRFAYGHDEYMYRVLLHNKTTIPKEGLACVRYHSCYPLHQSDFYEKFYAPGDKELVDFVRDFNRFDLYTKKDDVDSYNVEALREYYVDLASKYLPTEIAW